MSKILIEEVCEELVNRGFDATIQKVKKTNKTVEGLVVRINDLDVCPVIYEETLELFRAPSIMKLCDQLEDYIEKFIDDNLMSDIGKLKDKDYILENVKLALCNKIWNEDMLSELIHIDIPELSLAVYPYIEIGNGFVKMRTDMTKEIGLGNREVLNRAWENSSEDCVIMDVRDSMKNYVTNESDSKLLEFMKTPMLIITNRGRFMGASSMLFIENLQRAIDILGVDKAYIIPSSVHEVLITPVTELITKEDIDLFICDTNLKFLQSSDRLHYQCFVYDRYGRD